MVEGTRAKGVHTYGFTVGFRVQAKVAGAVKKLMDENQVADWRIEPTTS